jgi:hypothetical protein
VWTIGWTDLNARLTMQIISQFYALDYDLRINYLQLWGVQISTKILISVQSKSKKKNVRLAIKWSQVPILLTSFSLIHCIKGPTQSNFIMKYFCQWLLEHRRCEVWGYFIFLQIIIGLVYNMYTCRSDILTGISLLEVGVESTLN